MDFQENWFDEMDIPELRHYVRRPSFLTANGFYWAIAVMFALMQAGMPVLYWLLSAVWDISYTGYTTALQILLYLGAMLMPLGVYILSRPQEREAFRLRGASVGRMLCAVLAAGFGYFAANFIAVLWVIALECLGLQNTAAPDVLTGSLPLDLILISILPAVCEELLFRGLVLGTYERWGTRRAIWISAALFAGLHGSVVGLPVHLLMGLVLGYVAASTGSLLPGMALHGVYNAIAVVIACGAPADPGVDLPMLEQIGGVMGVAVCVMMLLVSAALCFAVLRRMDRYRLQADEPFGSDAVIERRRLGRTELILLVSGVVTVIWFYLQDFLDMLR